MVTRIICCLSLVFACRTAYGEALAPLPRQRYTPGSRDDALKWQEELRGRFALLLKIDDLIAKRSSIPFKTKELSSQQKGGFIVKTIEINTTPGRRITCVVTIPDTGKEPFPAVVCLGGHGSTLKSPYAPSTVEKSKKRAGWDAIYKAFGTELASRGYATISTTVSQHKVYEKGRTLMGERLWDCMRCVDYLCSLSCVDNDRIGCGGLSLGGEMAMWLGAMDTRVHAVVSAGFLTFMDQMEQNHCMCWKFEGLRDLVDFPDIYAMTAPRPLMCQNGLKEPESQFYVPLARRAWSRILPAYQDFERPENVVLDVHKGAHEIDLPALLYFFEKHL